MIGVYLHIPFCRRKCRYCDFYSYPPDGDAFSRYTDGLIRRIGEAPEGLSADTVFFGGGTPTLLPAECLIRILDAVRDRFSLSPDAEISIECNPATATEDDLRRLKEAGFNRLSIGMQSADDGELRLLGRLHDRAECDRCFEDARRAGFDNINLDLMYALPGQTQESLKATLAHVIALNPEHISAYCLKIEEGTPFANDQTLVLPDDEDALSMYLSVCKTLGEAGYAPYEISNFSKPGFRCRHNVKYWMGESYLGFGPASHSYFDGCRYGYPRDTEKYLAGCSPVPEDDEDVSLSPGSEGEYLMLRLRLYDGIDLADYRERFGKDFRAVYGSKLENYVKAGFVILDRSHCAFTPLGMFVSNHILAELL